MVSPYGKSKKPTKRKPKKKPRRRRFSPQYLAYLRSTAWHEKRRLVLEAAGHRCQVCGATDRLDVHHKTYDRLFKERLDDLAVLCRRCHKLWHSPSRKTMRHLDR